MACNGTCTTCKHKYCARKVSLFESFSEEDLGKVVALIERRHFEKGDIIFSEGDVFDRLYIVNGGSMKVFRDNKEGKEQIIYILSEGDFIGDLSLLKKSVFQFSAVALETTDLCTIKKDDFDFLIKNSEMVNTKVLEYAHDRIESLETLVKTLTTKDVETRIAGMLIMMAERFGIRRQRGIEIQLTLTREEMANFLGLTRETVSRKLSAFQSEGLLELLENKTILIKDYEALEAMSEL